MADTNTVRKADLPAPKLSPDTFKQLRDLIYEKTGIFFPGQ
jgi:chemotaxis protein methyltransferase CheR